MPGWPIPGGIPGTVTGHRVQLTELLPGLARVGEQEVDLGGAEVALVDLHVLVPVEARGAKASSRNSRTEWVSPVPMT
jgi:hypothetical protein